MRIQGVLTYRIESLGTRDRIRSQPTVVTQVRSTDDVDLFKRASISLKIRSFHYKISSTS